MFVSTLRYYDDFVEIRFSGELKIINGGEL